MKLTDIMGLLGGLALFLYGMQMMSQGLENAAGDKMKQILEKLTSNRLLGGRCCYYRSDPVLFGDNCNGGRICKFRNDDINTGNLDHHGC